MKPGGKNPQANDPVRSPYRLLSPPLPYGNLIITIPNFAFKEVPFFLKQGENKLEKGGEGAGKGQGSS